MFCSTSFFTLTYLIFLYILIQQENVFLQRKQVDGTLYCFIVVCWF